MKICLVSAFPPSRRGLNEYGFHIARELQQDSLCSLIILADQLEGQDAQPELENFDVQRIWRFNSILTPARLIRAVRRFRPDVLWFNLLFSTFGNQPIAAFGGLAAPALTRALGCYTHITLHHLMDNIDLKDANVRFPHLYRVAGNVATRMLLMANSVSVLLPAYRRTLIERYRGENVHFRAHGIFSARPEYPNFARRGHPEHRILAFGKWGTYKRLELLIEAFSLVVSHLPQARLIIAGPDHPMAPGYVNSMAQRFAGHAKIEFTGYVPEEKSLICSAQPVFWSCRITPRPEPAGLRTWHASTVCLSFRPISPISVPWRKTKIWQSISTKSAIRKAWPAKCCGSWVTGKCSARWRNRTFLPPCA